MTIQQVDPIALRQKLRKLGIGPGLPMSQTFAEDAVRASALWPGVEDFPMRSDLRLEPAELAYCLDAWAALWQVPA